MAAVLLLAGCTTHTSGTPDKQLQQQAAADANQVHHDLKAAGKEAKRALVQARRETKDAVAGARRGWKEDSGHSGAVDINHAGAVTLETLPGIHASTARAIVAGRPYDSAHQLVSRGILSHDQYERIADDVTAR